MKKFTKVIFLIIGLIGVTSIAVVQAEQPYKHITYVTLKHHLKHFLEEQFMY